MLDLQTMKIVNKVDTWSQVHNFTFKSKSKTCGSSLLASFIFKYSFCSNKSANQLITELYMLILL